MRGVFIPSPTPLMIAIALVTGCATARPKKPATTRPLEPGVGACRAAIESEETTGLIRYVGDAKETREIWDTDADGNPERELRKVRDADGRVIQIEQFDATGRLVQRIEREWDDDRLIAERGDRWDDQGRPGPDGEPDWVHQLEWDDGQLVAEYVDETDEDGLPGIDGEPEFVTKWTWQGGRRVDGEKRHEGLVVASFEREYAGGRLRREATDWGDDGTIDEETTYEYDAEGRVRTLVHRTQGGGYTATYTYQCSG